MDNFFNAVIIFSVIFSLVLILIINKRTLNDIKNCEIKNNNLHRRLEELKSSNSTIYELFDTLQEDVLSHEDLTDKINVQIDKKLEFLVDSLNRKKINETPKKGKRNVKA